MSSDAGIDMSSSEVQRHLRAKAKLRQRAAQPRVSRASHRHDSDLPAGQHPVDRWLVLDLGQMSSCGAHDYDPWNDRMEHTITFKGLASCQNDGAAADTWDDFPAVDWHCVTGWSHRGLRFRGVWLHKVLEYVQPRQDWDCLYQTSADGYTVPVHKEDAVGGAVGGAAQHNAAAFLAITDGDGEMLPFEHGGPRLVFPTLYGWKSAKYLASVTFLPVVKEGFWERFGCNSRGRWQLEERWATRSKRTWTVLAWITAKYRVFGDSVWMWVMIKGGRAAGHLAALLGVYKDPGGDGAT